MIYSLDGHSAQQLLTYLPASWTHRVKSIFYGQDGKDLRSVDALDSAFDGSHGDQFVDVRKSPDTGDKAQADLLERRR